MPKSIKLYAEIGKSEELSDGTIKVWGYASTNTVDADGETVTADAMKAALPDYMKFGAVREMHDSKKAAGTAIEASVGDDGRTFFGAHIVDAEAVKKVKAGVYKGFSIGGKITLRDDLNKSIIKGVKLVEVSLVDRPANPEAVITIMKADATPEDDVIELADLLDKGEITPAQVLDLIKAAKNPPEQATEPVVEVKKGMGHVAQMALLLKAILALVNDQVAEAMREGDASDMPAKLQDWLNAGGELLKEMTAEETAELQANTDEGQTDWSAPSAIYLADKILGLVKADNIEKAGAALSAKNKEKLQAIHDHTADMGCCTGAAKAAQAENLAKAESDKAAISEQLTKASADLDLAKAEAATLTKRVAELEAKPQPGKALLKVISKAQDTGTEQELPTIVPITKSDGSLDAAATLIKAIHARH